MYDTIGFHLISKNSQDCLKHLSRGKEEIDRETGLILCKGKLENLTVKVNSENISIFGSLPKFYLGSNLQQLTRKDTEKAIEKLSDLLYLPIDESRTYRLDVGANLIVDEPLQNYYSCLGILPRFKRSEIANKQTLLYTTSKRAQEYYDKGRDAIRTKTIIPEPLKNQRVMRIETHLTRKVAEAFKLQELRAKDLYNENIYMQSIDLWQKYYFSIQRIKKLRFNKEALEMVNAKMLEKQLALIGLKTIGEMEISQMIESSKGDIDKMQLSRLRKKLKEIAQQPELTEPN